VIKAQLWVEMDPETSDAALSLLDVLAAAEAKTLNRDVGKRETSINPDSGLMLICWPLHPRH
jgi:hypothetical protein